MLDLLLDGGLSDPKTSQSVIKEAATSGTCRHKNVRTSTSYDLVESIGRHSKLKLFYDTNRDGHETSSLTIPCKESI